MDIDLRKLNHLITVARCGSFSRAADTLHITQPALSRSIAAVEAHFGLKIFDRSRSGAALTPVGAMAVAEAEALLRRAQTLDHNLRLYGRGEAGRIAFGMGPLVASVALPTLSSHFMNLSPRLHMRASVKTANTLRQELKEDQIEMMFCGSGQMDMSPDIRVETIGHLSLALLVRTNHPLTQRSEVLNNDLFDYPIFSALELSDKAPQPRGGSFICDNYDILKTTVLQTDGIWISSPQLVRTELEQGLMTTIETSDPNRPARIDVCLARLQDSQPSPAAIAIVDYLKGFFAGLETPPSG